MTNTDYSWTPTVPHSLWVEPPSSGTREVISEAEVGAAASTDWRHLLLVRSRVPCQPPACCSPLERCHLDCQLLLYHLPIKLKWHLLQFSKPEKKHARLKEIRCEDELTCTTVKLVIQSKEPFSMQENISWKQSRPRRGWRTMLWSGLGRIGLSWLHFV